jgi:CRISPR/Cas system CSM-associated protein Csm3 (group 7 of RAMP superfamily)
MHRRLVNEATLDLALWPDGPLLVKAADTGADPTRPDMEFVRTHRAGAETVYLPGSSLKGALRAHCERIARTVGGETAARRPRLSCNPLRDDPDGPHYSCNRRLRRIPPNESTPERLYRESCAVCQLFGNQHVAAHLRTADAYPPAPPRAEQRTSVAIDRVHGSVAQGPFNYEVVTEGRFETRLALRNFSLAQLGLVALALRDLADGRLALGFGKSRGFGRMGLEIASAGFRYPGCAVQDGELRTLAGVVIGPADQLHGAGAFPDTARYGFPTPDAVPLPDGRAAADDGWGAAEVTLGADDAAALTALWRACVGRWADLVQTAVAGR